MPEGYYRSGQAARELGVSSYTIRRLCEAGVIQAELSQGKHWRIPVAEVAKMGEEGVPPIPQELEEPEPAEAAPPPAARTTHREKYASSELYAEPSEEVITAAEQVKIAESTLQRRRVELETQEVEDRFLEHKRQRAERKAAEEEREKAIRAAQRRQHWLDRWLERALNGLPRGIPADIKLEVNSAVQGALAGVNPAQRESVTLQLVNAAIEKASRPWTRKQQIRQACDAAIDRLPREMKDSPEFADLKKRAEDAALSAVAAVAADAGRAEMEAAATRAMVPALREFEHIQRCIRAATRVYISDATTEETQAAKRAVCEAVLRLPIGTPDQEINKAKEAALAPFEAKLAARKQAERVQLEQRRRCDRAEWTVVLHIGHVTTCLQREFEFTGGYTEMSRESARLQQLIRPQLIQAIVDRPDINGSDLRTIVERLIEDLVSDRAKRRRRSQPAV